MYPYAIVETGGKQYRLSPGQTIDVELLDTSAKTHTFDKVLLYADGKQVKIGTPYLKDIVVEAKIIEHEFKGPKIRIMRYKAKSRYRRHLGHRQRFTRLEVIKVEPKK